MSPEQAKYQSRLLAGTDPAHLEAERQVVIVEVRPGYLMDLAVVPRTYFERLPNYSASLPTGKRFGKRWRANIHAYNPDEPDEWILGEYVDLNEQERVGIKWRRLQIAEVWILESLYRKVTE